MAESVFEAVKQSVTVREAAQMYGIEVNRSGMACCPFHDDKNPSMKLNEEYFYCFGCGATGDVIDFTARLYNLSPKEAAEKLAQDFGLAYDSQAPPRRRYVRRKSEAQKFKEDRDHAFRVLADYFHLLRKWETDYTPKTPEENPHPRFMEAIQKKDYVGYLLDFFLEDTPDEQRLWIAEHQSEIANLERRVKIMADKPTNRERLQEITAGIEQGIKELFESEKYIYTAPLDGSGSTMEQLERLYEQFNLQKPVDFHSPSMSVSDIVAIKQNGQVSCHYCDSVGFTQVQGFLPENSLRNAEMTVEDDYGMIDGIINNGPKEPTVAQLEQQARSGQPISLMDLAAAVHREEREKKKSVMEQLKSQPKTEHKKTAQKKSAEREL